MPSSVRPYIPWNLLNLPAGIVPMSKVTKEDDFGLKSLPNNDMVVRVDGKSYPTKASNNRVGSSIDPIQLNASLLLFQD